MVQDPKKQHTMRWSKEIQEMRNKVIASYNTVASEAW